VKQYVGKSLTRVDGIAKATGEHKYPSDLHLPGVLHLKMVRSTKAHALIKSLDTTGAEAMDGVWVFTAKDLVYNRFGNILKDQPIFCEDRVRFYGEPIALVAASSKKLAEQASGKIKVSYEELPLVMDVEEALKPEAPPLHPDGNLLQKISFENRDVKAGFEQAVLVLEDEFITPMVDHLYLETEAGIAYQDDDGILNVLAGTQNPFHDQREISAALGLPLEKIRVQAIPTGGGFGGKDGNTVQIYLALAAYKTGRPCRMVMSREESLVTSYKRHPAKIRAKMGFAADGEILAFEGKVIFDTGAYAALGPAVLGLGTEHFQGPYEIKNVKIDGYLVYTNKPPASAMRGFGAPQTLFATETLLNKAAKELRLDPIKLRLRNALRTQGEGPFGQQMKHSVGVREALELAQNSSLWQEKQRNRESGVAYGVAAGFLSCGMGAGIVDRAKVIIEKHGDKYIVKVGVVELGQGNLTAFAQIAADVLGVPAEAIEVVAGDTGRTYDCGSTAASRSTYITGNAIIKAAQDLRAKGGSEGIGESVFPESSIKDVGVGLPHVMYTFLVNVVKLALDPLTGEIRLLDALAVTEAGRIVNPVLLDAQIQGGFGQGVGYALMEQVDFDECGKVRQTDLSTYLIPTAKDICDIQNMTVTAYENTGPYGVKGAAEVGTVCVAPAITGALMGGWDLYITQLPVSREEIIRQLREKGVITGKVG
jgi:xanthine dehydrogenase molybdenum-binding subunit